MTATREIYWNIENPYGMYVLLVIAAGIFGWGIHRRRRLWKTGRSENRIDAPLKRAGFTAKHVFTHGMLFRYPAAGIAHGLLFAGFFLLFIGTLLVFLEADFGIKVMHGWPYLIFQSLVLDIAGISVLTGAALFALYRYALKTGRYRCTRDDLIALISIFSIIVTGFFLEGIRLQATGDGWTAWSPVGQWTARFFSGSEAEKLSGVYQPLWWLHLCLSLGLFAWLPFSKMRHVLLGPLNIFFSPFGPKAITVQPLDFEADGALGAEKLSDMSWKHLFDLDACTECGRCEDICPVTIAGQEFSPRNVILGLRSMLDRDQTGAPVIETAFDEKTVWYCRTCRACMEECPVFIEIVPKFIELRRFQVMENAEFPDTLQDAMRSLESRGHPYRGTMSSRTDWCRGMGITEVGDTAEVDVLYWVGCTTALNEDVMESGRSLAMLLKDAGIRFGILGENESCCGEPARRIGNEYMYEMTARQNIEQLKTIRHDMIVTNCPHCYNVLKFEYRQFGADLNVWHHSQFLLKMIKDGKLRIDRRIEDEIAYHDPCYLSRYNRIIDAPRELIETVSKRPLKALKRSKDKSFCCGGGGGGAWIGEEGEIQRINVVRAGQVLETGASIVATACPFCLMMMKDGVNTVDPDGESRVLDIAQILVQGRNDESAGIKTGGNP